MADFDSSIFRTIKLCQKFQKIISSKNQQLKHMKNAWKSKIDYGHIHEKGDSVLPILGVWGLVLDANSFLAMSVRQWKCFEALNRPANVISVFKFFMKILQLCSEFMSSFSCLLE